MTSAKAAGIIPILFLAACAHGPEAKIVTRDMKLEVIKPCVPADLPAKPAHYADEGEEHMAPGPRYLAVAQANQERKARLAKVEPVIAGCH